MKEIEFRAFIKKTKIMLNVEDLNFQYDSIIACNHHTYDLRECEIMQFTGIRDRNNVKIFEGDVVYIAGTGNYVVKDIREDFDFLINAVVEKDMGEIVGDIYQNPELLIKNQLFL
jgi:predicted RNase H-like nuclease (RuvC/YqgF family)